MDRVIREISGTLLKSGPELADGQLLEMFRSRRNEAAFEAIVRRHGPMVLAVCRRILRNHHDAEDAFQATFLVLARKSGSIASRERTASWLYGVAVRTAQKSRTQVARLRARELRAAIPIDATTTARESESDLQESLDRELARLPDKYRMPIVLCELEGKSHKEAARELRWPEGTLSVRLMRAKELLTQRLARQGLGTTAGAIAILSAPCIAPASVPSALVSSSVTFASRFADKAGGAAIPANVSALADNVLRGLLMSKMKSLIGMIVLLGVVLGGAVFSACALSAGFQAEKPVVALVAQVPQEPKKDKVDVVDEKAAVAVDGPKQGKQPRLDSFGDPLPEGAAARLGARRFRYDVFGPRLKLAFTPDSKTLIGNSGYGVLFWDAATGIERQHLKSGSLLALSPDGTTMAVCGKRHADDPWFGLCDLRSGKRFRTLSASDGKGDKSDPSSAQFSSDGKSLVMCFDNGTALVFDVASSDVRASFGGPDSFECYNVAVSPDCKTLVAATHSTGDNAKSHSLRWWDFATGKPIRAVRELPHAVSSMAISPDNKTLALGIDTDYEIMLLDLATEKAIGRLKFEKSARKLDSRPLRITDIAFTPDSKKLVAASMAEGVIGVWDRASGKTLHVMESRDYPSLLPSMSLSPDGKTVAFAQFGNVVRLWDVATGKERFPERLGHEILIRALEFSPDGKTLASSGWLFGQTILWDWASKTRIGFLPASVTTSHNLSFSPDGKRLVTAGGTATSLNQRLRVWDVVTRKETTLSTVDDESKMITSAVFSPDGKKLLTLDGTERGEEQALRRWDLTTGKKEESWPIPKGQRADHLMPDGKQLLVADRMSRPDGKRNDRHFSIYDPQTGRRKAASNELSITPCTLSSDGRIAGSFSLNQKALELCEICTGQQICTLKGPHELSVIAWSPDGSLLATRHRGDTEPLPIRIWDTATGNQRAILSGFEGEVTAWTFSPDGAYLVAGMLDGTILVWEMADAIPRTPSPRLTNDDLEARWTDLVSDKAAQAHQAIGILVAAPKQSVPFLRSRLQPTPVAEAGKIQRWIADLDSDQFAVRESASKELAKFDAQIESHVRKALKRNVAPETARRLERILSTVESLDSNAVRTIRSITILERIGSPDARAVLEALAGGAPGSLATEEATESLQRLLRRR